MSEIFNLSAATTRELDQLYKDKVIDSKELFLELAISVGLVKEKKEEVRNPRPFHTLSEMDKGHVFSIIATTRNLELITEEQVARELEMYAEAGIKEIKEKDIKDNKLDLYKTIKKYSDL